jgi:hypothetical protein
MPVGETQPPGPGVVDKRRVAPAAEKQAREALARDCAKAAVMGVVKRLVETAPAAEGGKR